MIVKDPNLPRTNPPKRSAVLARLGEFLQDRFSLEEDREDEAGVIQSISRGIEFRGISLWTLIFAIFIASIGLNVNSTAVIIGAMLISPVNGSHYGYWPGRGHQ